MVGQCSASIRASLTKVESFRPTRKAREGRKVTVWCAVGAHRLCSLSQVGKSLRVSRQRCTGQEHGLHQLIKGHFATRCCRAGGGGADCGKHEGPFGDQNHVLILVWVHSPTLPKQAVTLSKHVSHEIVSLPRQSDDQLLGSAASVAASFPPTPGTMPRTLLSICLGRPSPRSRPFVRLRPGVVTPASDLTTVGFRPVRQTRLWNFLASWLYLVDASRGSA